MSLHTYPYAKTFDPPALILDVKVVHPDPQDKRCTKRKAKIDTGADISVIPVNIRDDWKLYKTGEITICDFKREVKMEPTYNVRIIINKLVSKIVEVTVSNREDLLLGRDILNDLKMCANGKSRLFTLEDP